MLQSILDISLLSEFNHLKRASELWLALKQKFHKTDSGTKAKLLRRVLDLARFEESTDVKGGLSMTKEVVPTLVIDKPPFYYIKQYSKHHQQNKTPQSSSEVANGNIQILHSLSPRLDDIFSSNSLPSMPKDSKQQHLPLSCFSALQECNTLQQHLTHCSFLVLKECNTSAAYCTIKEGHILSSKAFTWEERNSLVLIPKDNKQCLSLNSFKEIEEHNSVCSRHNHQRSTTSIDRQTHISQQLQSSTIEH